MGDELLWDTFKYMCKKYKIDEAYKIITNLEDADLSNLSHYDVIVLGGGSLLLPGYIEILYKGHISGSKIFIWGTGYDWAEKDCIYSLEENDTPAYLYPDETEILLEDLIPSCSFCGVRGPLTYTLLKKSFINVDNVIVCGDACFALEPEPLENYMPIINLSDKDNIVAVNWGTSFNRIYGNNEESVEYNLAKVCNYLLDKGYTVYLYIMWSEDLEALMSLYKKITPNNNLIIDTNIYSGGQLLSILKRCVFSINLKLHGNILSATANIPFICLGYRFKCFDFAKSIDCENLIISTDSKNLYSNLIDTINYITNNYSIIKSSLKNHINYFKKKIEYPFSKNLF